MRLPYLLLKWNRFRPNQSFFLCHALFELSMIVEGTVSDILLFILKNRMIYETGLQKNGTCNIAAESEDHPKQGC